jgi:hypothetical protein
MGDPNRQPYFQIEGRGLVRLICFVIAICAAIPVVKKVSLIINNGLRYAFNAGDWTDVFMIVVMLIIMMVAGSVALKGKFSIP